MKTFPVSTCAGVRHDPEAKERGGWSEKVTISYVQNGQCN